MSVAELVAGLGEIAELDVILDTGTLDQRAPSSIVDLTGERPRLLRAGSVTADQLRVVLGDLEVLDLEVADPPIEDLIGQLFQQGVVQ